MAISYPFMDLTGQYASEAKKQRYNTELTGQYINDKTRANRKQTPVSDALILSTASAIAGKIVLDSRKQQIPLWDATKKMFTPFTNEVNNSLKATSELFAKNDGLIKPMAKLAVETVKDIGRFSRGIWKSIPPVIKIPAALLIGAHAIYSYSENKKIEAKYDTLQHIEDNKN